MRMMSVGGRSVATPLRTATMLLFTVLAGASMPSFGDAQVTRADSAAVILEAASRFEAERQPEVAEALYRMILERFGDTSFAERARERLSGVASRSALSSGQTELQVWTTLYGLWLGIAVPGAFSANGPEPYGVGLLLGGPAGILSGRALARSMSLTSGQARAITLGGTWGTWQGLGWALALDFGEERICNGGVCYNGGDTGEEVLSSMIVGGLAGIGVGAALARRPISDGGGTTVNFGALWGTWFGFATSIVLGINEEDNVLASALVGGNVGLVTTALLSPRWRLSRNRARVISIAGVIGGLGGVGIDLIAQPHNEKVAMGIPLATSVLGLTIGALTSNDGNGPSGGPGRGSSGDFDAPASRALLSFESGKLGLGLPPITPTFLEGRAVDGLSTWRPGVAVALLRATF